MVGLADLPYAEIIVRVTFDEAGQSSRT